MTLQYPYLVQSDYDSFLYAVIEEEPSEPSGDGIGGIPTTVMSALTRLNIDPWQEAARLSAMPRDRAADAICLWIAQLPNEQWKPSDIADIAAQLADLLPQSRAPAPRRRRSAPVVSRKSAVTIVVWLVGLTLGAMMLFTLFVDRGKMPGNGVTVGPPVTGPILPGE